MAKMMTDFFYGFQESKIKPYLKMAVQRMQIASNKKSASVKHLKREIATLLQENKDEKARIKVEHVIREDFMIESYELLQLLCDLVHERIRYIGSEKECPPDLIEGISSIIWATNRVEIEELQEVRNQFKLKYGSDFIKNADENASSVVNARLLQKLSVQPPSAFLVVRYLEEIAKEYNVEWTHTDLGLPEGGAGLGAIPSPMGFSVPMAPGSELRSAYQRQAVVSGAVGAAAAALDSSAASAIPAAPQHDPTKPAAIPSAPGAATKDGTVVAPFLPSAAPAAPYPGTPGMPMSQYPPQQQPPYGGSNSGYPGYPYQPPPPPPPLPTNGMPAYPMYGAPSQGAFYPGYPQGPWQGPGQGGAAYQVPVAGIPPQGPQMPLSQYPLQQGLPPQGQFPPADGSGAHVPIVEAIAAPISPTSTSTTVTAAPVLPPSAPVHAGYVSGPEALGDDCPKCHATSDAAADIILNDGTHVPAHANTAHVSPAASEVYNDGSRPHPPTSLPPSDNRQLSGNPPVTAQGQGTNNNSNNIHNRDHDNRQYQGLSSSPLLPPPSYDSTTPGTMIIPELPVAPLGSTRNLNAGGGSGNYSSNRLSAPDSTIFPTPDYAADGLPVQPSAPSTAGNSGASVAAIDDSFDALAARFAALQRDT